MIFFKDKQTHAKRLLQSINAYLPVKYLKNEQTPQIFRTVFSVTNNKYNTQSCRGLTFSKTLYKAKTNSIQYIFSWTLFME